MAHDKHRGKQGCRNVFPVGGEQDECQAGRDGQQEDDPCVGISSIVQYPSSVINHDTNHRSDDQRRKTQLPPFLVDDKT